MGEHGPSTTPSHWREDFSLRAIGTGAALGAVLSACNIYSGLKIGWSSNMSITGALLAFALWKVARPRKRAFSMLETNLSQAACSAAAAVSSAGLVAGIPALSVLTGRVLSWPALAAWVFSVCVVGIMIAVPIRRAMIVLEPLPFPYGIAAAETIRGMYSKGAAALRQVYLLIAGGIAAGIWKLLEHLKVLKAVAFPGAIGAQPLKQLTFALDPSVLLVAVGGIMGPRAAISVFAGSIVSFGALGPAIVENGWVRTGKPDKSWFPELVEWLLWPGVTLMVVSSIASVLLSWRTVSRSFSGLFARISADADATDVPPTFLRAGFAIAIVLSICLQVLLFGIPIWAAFIGLALSLVLAVVAARVNGETGVTPIGAMGKVTQLTMGAALPGDVTANLMTANVTGGGASQCADLMNDLKTGRILGSTPCSQWLSQLAGALAGSLAGSAIYLALITNAKEQLFTEEWAAPAVTTWKAVAEIFSRGLSALPPHVGTAVAIAAAIGALLAVAEKTAPRHIAARLPSAPAFGLGFVVPANQSLSMLLGGLLAFAVVRFSKDWSERYWIVGCSGVVAGESLVGVGISIHGMLAR
ncbi:MAG: OPT/YSL family transporter [Polyangiaceae bacterium]|nr:OPT/YSL family transporter [Polyangiaceae bacterium]